MYPETQVQTPGEEFGRKAVEEALAKAAAYCGHETQRIALESESRVAALGAELARLRDDEHILQARLQRALPTGDAKDRRRKALYYWIVTIALTVAGFFFSLLAFAPYRLGWKSYLYCAGIALVAPFCVEKFLETWSSPKLMKALATAACLSALTSLVLLSLIRGDVLAEQIHAVSPVVILAGESPQAPPPQTEFYDKTVCLLRLVMALLAFSMELGAGLALYEARRYSANAGEDYDRLLAELNSIRQHMVARLAELRSAQNAAPMFQNQFWRDFYHALSDGVSRTSLVKIFALALCLMLVFATQARAESLSLVITLDLSKSVAVGAPGQRQEFNKNVEATGEILAHIPASSHVMIIGITDQSFGEPVILLDARIPPDPGYFDERLTAARRALLQAWLTRTKALAPSFRHTDILGALLLASQVFQAQPKGRRVLVIFSDMRENAGNLNLGESNLKSAHLAP
jgi:hypothetical protein